MYDMYADWGPAKHDPEHPMHRQPATGPLQVAIDRRDHRVGLDLRDDDASRPDDN
jgi:hypothetical protein